MPKKDKNWPKSADESNRRHMATSEEQEMQNAMARVYAFPENTCALCLETLLGYYLLRWHICDEHGFTIDGEKISQPQSQQSQENRPVPSTSCSQPLGDDLSVRAYLLSISSSSSSVATSQRPETPVVFSVASDSEPEEGEIHEEVP